MRDAEPNVLELLRANDFRLLREWEEMSSSLIPNWSALADPLASAYLLDPPPVGQKLSETLKNVRALP